MSPNIPMRRPGQHVAARCSGVDQRYDDVQPTHQRSLLRGGCLGCFAREDDAEHCTESADIEDTDPVLSRNRGPIRSSDGLRPRWTLGRTHPARCGDIQRRINNLGRSRYHRRIRRRRDVHQHGSRPTRPRSLERSCLSDSRQAWRRWGLFSCLQIRIVSCRRPLKSA
jgi:hypothetical protein